MVLYVVGEPYARGFFCDDETLRYPDVPSTVSNKALYLGGILIPVFVITAVEVYCHLTNRIPLDSTSSLHRISGMKISPLLVRLVVSLRYFLFGACISQFVTDVAKYTIGRLRPHFWAVCVPNIDCSKVEPQFYVSNYTCLNPSWFDSRETKLSFLSGHASFSFYGAVYLVMFLQCRDLLRLSKLARPVIQTLLLMLAWFTALTRVSDYKHHPTDVGAGIAVGAIVGFVTVSCLSVWLSLYLVL
ncbi:PPAP2A [Cordylochernes scorpioides]|uniref:PPAP2A n=1 Tax=Cordylochernes scorpioides TaxID=51811 RepID=A0ABY6KF52_9ARAC|nr:PPAP2A [Cordylochernes scorpioides]